MMEQQSTADVLMVRPTRFAGNVQTAASNRFQTLGAAPDELRVQRAALAEFDGLVAVLQDAGVRAHVFEDTLEPHTPDSIFPNNWVSFHADGTAALYPMLAENRRLERRMDILQSLSAKKGFRIDRTVDLTTHELESKFLEGTGSLVLDRVHRVAYACLSPRTDLDVLGEFAQRLDYELVTFEAHDAGGVPIYHTNVLMCIGTSFAVLCKELIAPHEQEAVCATLKATGHALVEISAAQMYAFAGNMLELQNAQGEKRVAMSSRALSALDAQQRTQLQEHAAALIAAPIPTIEKLGGGSVRCMLAEIFLPKK